MRVTFLDESGDHQLKRINTGYPLFALGGVIIDRAYVRDVVEPQMSAFKRQYFGHENMGSVPVAPASIDTSPGGGGR